MSEIISTRPQEIILRSVFQHFWQLKNISSKGLFWYKKILEKQDNAKLRRTAPGAKKSPVSNIHLPPPPLKCGQKWKCHKIFLNTVLKIIFSKKHIPGSKCATCSSFTDRKYPKNAQKYPKKGHKMVKNQIFEKRLKIISWYRPKDHISKTLGSYAKNYV